MTELRRNRRLEMLVDLAALLADLGNISLAAKLLKRRGISIRVAKRVLLDPSRHRHSALNEGKSSS